LGRQLEAPEPDAEPRPRARWSTHYSPRTYVPLDPATVRRLRRAVAVWPEEPGLTPAPTLLRRRHLLLHGHRAASPGAASLGAATRGAAMRSAACAAPPFAATPASDATPERGEEEEADGVRPYREATQLTRAHDRQKTLPQRRCTSCV